MPELVSIKEAATRLGVSADTIRRRLKSGDLIGEQQKTAQGFTWLINLPDDVAPAQPSATVAAPIAGVTLPIDTAVELAQLQARAELLERERNELIEQRDLWHESYQDEARRREEAERRRDEADKRRDEAELELRNILLSHRATPLQLASIIDTDAPVLASEQPMHTTPAADQQAPTRRSWWRRMLGV